MACGFFAGRGVSGHGRPLQAHVALNRLNSDKSGKIPMKVFIKATAFVLG